MERMRWRDTWDLKDNGVLRLWLHDETNVLEI